MPTNLTEKLWNSSQLLQRDCSKHTAIVNIDY